MESNPEKSVNNNERVTNKLESVEVLPREPVSLDSVSVEINNITEEINKQE